MSKSTSTSTLEQIQELVRIRLITLFAGDSLGVLSEDQAETEYEVQKAVDEIGVSIIVRYPVPRVSRPNLPGPYFDSIEIAILIAESPIVNQGATAIEIAERILRSLHQFNLNLFDGQHCMVIAQSNALTVEDAPEGYRSFGVNFETAAGLQARPE